MFVLIVYAVGGLVSVAETVNETTKSSATTFASVTVAVVGCISANFAPTE